MNINKKSHMKPVSSNITSFDWHLSLPGVPLRKENYFHLQNYNLYRKS